MAQDTATTAVLIHSVLATARIFVVLLAGFLASKWPKHEREYVNIVGNMFYSK